MLFLLFPSLLHPCAWEGYFAQHGELISYEVYSFVTFFVQPSWPLLFPQIELAALFSMLAQNVFYASIVVPTIYCKQEFILFC